MCIFLYIYLIIYKSNWKHVTTVDWGLRLRPSCVGRAISYLIMETLRGRLFTFIENGGHNSNGCAVTVNKSLEMSSLLCNNIYVAVSSAVRSCLLKISVMRLFKFWRFCLNLDNEYNLKWIKNLNWKYIHIVELFSK